MTNQINITKDQLKYLNGTKTHKDMKEMNITIPAKYKVGDILIRKSDGSRWGVFKGPFIFMNKYHYMIFSGDNLIKKTQIAEWELNKKFDKEH